MRFENLFARSARIVWRKPWLWLLALLAGETFGGSGSGSGNSGSLGTTRGGGTVSPPDLSWVPGWINDRIGLLLTIAGAALVVWVLLFLLSCLAEAALVGSVGRLDEGEPVGFGQAWRIGMRSFWRVLGFRAVQFLLILLGLLVLLLPPLLGAAGWGSGGALKGLLLDLPLLIASIAWIAFIGALAVLGLRACVLDGAGPVSAYREAYALLGRRFGRIALSWVLFAAAGIGVGIVIQVVLSIVVALFGGTLFNDLAAGRWSQLFNDAVLLLEVLTPVSLLLSSAAGAYFATAWTVAYRRFGQEGEVPEPPPLAA